MATVLRFFSRKASKGSTDQTPAYFPKIFRICSVQRDLGIIRFWIDSGCRCCHGNSFKIFQSSSFLVLQMPNSCMHFHQMFRICLPQHDMEFSKFWRNFMYPLAIATVLTFSSQILSWCFTAQTLTWIYIKYQDIFTTRASTTD